MILKSIKQQSYRVTHAVKCLCPSFGQAADVAALWSCKETVTFFRTPSYIGSS